MIRLVLVLCAGLFAALKIGGEDHGQVRFGLMPQPQQQSPKAATVLATVETSEPLVEDTAAPAPQDVVNASFVPDAPVMVAPVITAVETAPPVETIAGRVMYVSVKSLNVRAGPGTDYSVMDRLKRGDEVLVVALDDAPDAWAMIRIEGDGVEGYVSAALLTE